MEAGGADYITKPFSIAVLTKKIAAVFENLDTRTPRRELYDDGFFKNRLFKTFGGLER